jgi:transketolase
VGLGSAVAEVLVEEIPVPMERVGIKDTFAESGTYDAFLNKYGFGVSQIIEAAQMVITRKKGNWILPFRESSWNFKRND